MFNTIDTVDDASMVQRKKPATEDIGMTKRKNVATKLTNEELKQLRQMALDIDSSSVDIVTEAIRERLRRHFSTRS